MVLGTLLVLFREQARAVAGRCYRSYLHLSLNKQKTVTIRNDFRFFSFLLLNKLHFNFQKSYISSNRKFMDLISVIKVFEKHVPPYLAESWDNTGLLVEPSTKTTISTIFFTNDLTEDVLNEALEKKSDLIISYHPPVFTPLKSLKMTNWKEKILVKCIENSIAVYSPHTSCDAVANGVNYWLIHCFDIRDCQPIHQSYEPEPKYTHVLEFSLNVDANISEILRCVPDCELISLSSVPVGQNFKLKATKVSLALVMKLLSDCQDVNSMSLTTLSPLPLPSCGMGRIGKLVHPMALKDCIESVKQYLNLNYIRFSKAVSHSLDSEISVIAVCAGSGSSVLKGVKADLYITGEMSHHDLLDAVHRDVSVILCEHSNSERGYLRHLANILSSELTDVDLIVSSVDKDPVAIL